MRMRIIRFSFSPAAYVAAAAAFGVNMLLGGCGPDAQPVQAPQPPPYRAALTRVFDLDTALAGARDQAMGDRKDPGQGAVAIQQYVAAMRAVDMHDLPEDVRGAYNRHLDAWNALGELLARYGGFTGAFRFGFDGEDFAKAQVGRAQQTVEDSWTEVKNKARAYGVTPPSN